ncbi:MAG: hypothetical protein SGPRY_001716 [Prymnesium sp.]
MASCQDGETKPTGGGSLNNTSEKKEYIEETIQRTIRERSAHPVVRVGVGVHVLNVGDVDLKAGKFYADLQLYLHVETDEEGLDRQYDRESLLEPNLASCGSMDHFRRESLLRPYKPSAESEAMQDAGLFLVNIDRYRSISRRLEVVIEAQDEAVSRREGLFFCVMPEYSGLSDSIRFPGSIDNQRLSFELHTLETCGPPFLRPVRQCKEESSDRTSLLGLFDQQCECSTVTDYREGYDKESCGCQGGRVTSARLSFAVLYHTPELGAFVSAFLAPMIITAGFHAEGDVEVFNAGLVLFHAGLKAQTPVAGVLTLADKFMIGLYCIIGTSSFLPAAG